MEEKDVVTLDAAMVTNDPKKPKKTGLIVGIILVVVVAIAGVLVFLNRDKLFGDSDSDNGSETKKKEVLSEYQMTGNDLQDFDLYFMQLENNGKNMVYSPLSIKYALAMLSEGADGDTKSQIDAVIGEYVARKYTNSSNMSFANALFVRDSYKEHILTNYAEVLRNNFGAEFIFDSFSSPKTINDWVSGKTFKLIPNLLDDVDGLDYVLVNALAIDMEWKNKIQPEHESYAFAFQHEEVDRPDEDWKQAGVWVSALDGADYAAIDFKGVSYKAKSAEIAAVAHRYDIVKELGEDNIKKTVQAEYQKWLKEPGHAEEEEWFGKFDIDKYMEELKSNYNKISSSTDFLFYDDDDIKVFAKDLKTYDGVTLEYVGIMPKKDSLSDYVKNMDASKINKVVSNLKDVKMDNFEDGYVTIIEGYIPMFDYDYELNLKDDLKALGITDVFDGEKADLSKLTDTKTAIDSAVHKANIEFSNNGIKAAAATALGGYGAVDGGFEYRFNVPVKRIDLTFNNPYLYLIRDKETGEVWFAGTVYEPVKYVANTNW